MTMFTRNNDKSPETDKTPTPEAQRAPATPQPPRPQASVQPLGSSTPAPSPAGVSVISKAVKITGQIESTEDVQIDGEVDGDVRGVGVKVGSNAKVKGTVYGDSVECSGTVDGKIEAKKVVLTSTARMTGDIIHSDIRIDSGAYIDGHCRPEYGKGSKPAGNGGSSSS